MPLDIFEELRALDELRRELDHDDQNGTAHRIRGPVLESLGRVNRSSDLAYFRRIAQLRRESESEPI